MSAGTYELTVTDKTDAAKTASKTVDVTAQKATEIKILNDVALTGEKASGANGNSQLAYVYYDVLDQYGSSMRSSVNIDWSSSVKVANKNATIEDITFVSDSPLVIKEMTKAGSTVVIKDHEYDTVLVEPGIKVEQGGEVNVTAIANKTGNKPTLNVPVNVSEVLKSFVINAQSDIIADGEGAELSFTATDTKGNKITNFETIAKQVTFNKLQLTASTGVLKFVQQNDGTAKLTYQDPAMAWSDSQSTDGQDRIVSLTAIVVGGDTANQMLNISDKVRPTGVKDIAFNSAYVEGDSGSALTWGDLYDYTSAQANYKRKDCKDTLTVNVFELYDNDTTVATFGNALGTPKAYTEINKDVLLSDEAPKATTLTANAEAVTYGSAHTNIAMDDLDAHAIADKTVFVLKDQYGRDFVGIKYEVKDVKEAAGYADNIFTVLSNASATAKVNGAELADTFTLVGFYGTLSAKVNVTVGADGEAYIASDAGNVYLGTLVNGINGLEAQRQAGLK